MPKINSTIWLGKKFFFIALWMVSTSTKASVSIGVGFSWVLQ